MRWRWGVVVLLLALVGCGKQGPLYMPAVKPAPPAHHAAG
ncbi:MAG: LPS translocon maturation chaperone LptM [Acidiferrobacter sp.]